MRLSCSAHCLPDRPLSETLGVIAEAGFDAVELSWWQLERDFAGYGESLSAVRAALKKNKLAISGLNVADLAAVAGGELPDNAAVVRGQMASVRSLGLTAVNLRGGDRRRQSLEILIRGIETLLPAAERLRVNLNLGNAYGSRVEQLEDLREVLLRIGHPRLGVLNDTGQYHAAAVNPRYILREFGGRLGLVHIADRIGRRAVPLGDGEMNVPAIIEHLQQIGYTGWLVVDQEYSDAAAAVAGLSAARSMLQNLLARKT